MKPELKIRHLEKSIAANEISLNQSFWKQLIFFAVFFGLFMTVIMYAIDLQESGDHFSFLKAIKSFLLYSIAGAVSLMSSRLVTIALINRQKKKLEKLKENQGLT
jgi:heme/copper-type cytochrome/quinol oxidase subunit 3